MAEKTGGNGGPHETCGTCYHSEKTTNLVDLSAKALTCFVNPPFAQGFFQPGGKVGTLSIRPIVNATDRGCRLYAPSYKTNA